MADYGRPYTPMAHWGLYTAGIDANIAEANAAVATTRTGRIQICISHNAGTTTAGEITPYIQRLDGDAVYTAMPSTQMSAIAGADIILDPEDLGGPCDYKLVITNLAGAGGGPDFDLYIRDAHI